MAAFTFCGVIAKGYDIPIDQVEHNKTLFCWMKAKVRAERPVQMVAGFCWPSYFNPGLRYK
jgi:hypothetical protein